MGITSPRIVTQNEANSPPASVETVVNTLPGISTRGGGGQVQLFGCISITIGTGGTGVYVRVRRGQGAGGTVVAVYGPATVVAGDVYILPIQCEDTPGSVEDEAYSLTVQVVGATAQSTVGTCNLCAMF